LSAILQSLIERKGKAQPGTLSANLPNAAAPAGEGYRVHLYVPFGKAWYPYYMRRPSAEGPANVFFMLRNLFRR
jgi:proline dehydrogenase